MISFKMKCFGDTFHKIKPSLHLKYKPKTYQNDQNNKTSSF